MPSASAAEPQYPEAPESHDTFEVDDSIQFELISEATDLVDLTYQPICRVSCEASNI